MKKGFFCGKMVKVEGGFSVIFWIMLALAVFANALKGYCSKKLSGATQSLYDNVVINFYRAILCSIIGLFILVLSHKSFALTGRELFFCAVSGISMTAFQMAWLMSLKKGAYMMVSAFSSASFIIPCIVGFTVLGDEISWQKLLAIASISTAIFFLCRYNNKTKTKLTAVAFVFLVLVSASQGVNQIFQKLYNNLIAVKGSQSSLMAYTFYTFLVSSLVTLVMWAVLFFKEREKRLPRYGAKNWLLICVSSAGIYAASYFQTFAAKGIDASVMYPILNGLSLCAGTTMSIVIFGEKPKKESVIGILLVLAALMLNTLF